MIEPEIILLHRDFPLISGWAIFPLLPQLLMDKSSNTKWFAFLDEAAEVNFEALEAILTNHDVENPVLLGKLLRDDHKSQQHYNIIGTEYPDLKPGFFMTSSLVEILSKELLKDDSSLNMKFFPKYITMDVSFDLAKAIDYLITNQLYKKFPPRILNEDNFCATYDSRCAVFLRNTTCNIDQRNSLDVLNQTFFAVKTCKKFHQTRLPVLFDTWASKVPHILLASDTEDAALNTVVFPAAILKGKVNQCLKVVEIINYFNLHAEKMNWEWLVIVDDDTLLSVAKLANLLQCYQGYDEDLALGEVFGHLILPLGQTTGFDFLAGGSGKVFSRGLVKKLANLNGK